MKLLNCNNANMQFLFVNKTACLKLKQYKDSVYIFLRKKVDIFCYLIKIIVIIIIILSSPSTNINFTFRSSLFYPRMNIHGKCINYICTLSPSSVLCLSRTLSLSLTLSLTVPLRLGNVHIKTFHS